MTKFTFPAYNSDMTITVLTALYNSLAASPIKKFTDKAQAMKRLGAMHRQAMIDWLVAEATDGLTAEDLADRDNAQLAAMIRDVEAAPVEAPKTKAPKTKAPRAKREGNGIGATVRFLLAQGCSVEHITATLAERFPESAPGKDAKVAKKHIAWYACKAKAGV